MNELKRQRDLAESQLEQERSTHKEQKVLYYCIQGLYMLLVIPLVFYSTKKCFLGRMQHKCYFSVCN